MKKTLTVVAAATLLAGPYLSANAQTVATLGSGAEVVSLVNASGQMAPGLQLIGGYGQIDFSQGSDIAGFLEYADPTAISGAVGALNVLSGDLSGTLGAVVVEQQQDDALGDPNRYSASWRSPAATAVTMSSAGSNAGQMQSLSLAGGLSLTVPKKSGVATGGTLQLNNIRVELGTGQVMADLTGTRSAVGAKPAETFSSPNTVMWTVGSLAGPTRISPEALLATSPVSALTASGLAVVGPRVVTTYQPGGTCIGYNGYHYIYSCPIEVTSEGFTAVRADIQFNDLELTPEGSAFLSKSLGLQAVGDDAVTYVNDPVGSPGKWGSLRVGAFFRAVDPTGFLPVIPASIPEPSTYLLMGLGLAGVVLTKRSRTQRTP